MLSTLRSIIHTVNAAQGLQDTFDVIVTEVSRAMNTDICSVYLLNKEDNSHLLAANFGCTPKKSGKVIVPPGRGLVALINQQEEPLNFAEGSSQDAYFNIPNKEGIHPHAFLGVPILHHRQSLGVLVVEQTTKRIFNEEDEAFLVTLSAQLAGIIANAELLSLVESKKRKKSPTHLAASSSTTGIGIGKARVCSLTISVSSVPIRYSKNVEDEIIRLRKAMALARKDLRNFSATLSKKLAKQEVALFSAYEQLLSHNSLGRKIEQLIKEYKYSAPTALSKVIDENVKRFSAMDDPYLRDRASDILDLGNRVLSHLEQQNVTLKKYPRKTILVAENVTSAMIAEIPLNQLVGIISIKGSSTSHAAILARSLGMPALMGLRDCPVSALEGKTLIIDGYKALLFIKPARSFVDQYKLLQIDEQRMLDDLQIKSSGKSQTVDGVNIPLMVNCGLQADLNIESKISVDGVGLFRTEYFFMQSEYFPTEEEQRAIYRKILEQYEGKPVVIRTLDIGGDKSLPYFPINEENPFLGWRGIRITLDHPEIFHTQIRAMLKANIGLGNLSISLPMISTLSEVDKSLQQIKSVYDEIREANNYTEEEFQFPKIGIVIEVPAAVYQIKAIAKRADFLTIGSNDLTQYMFAVDRNNTRVSYLYKSLHPAIIQAILKICEAGNTEFIPVHICGEIAGDPLATPILLALGISSLSMNIHSIPKVRKIIQHYDMSDAANILAKVLELETSYEVRDYLTTVLTERGLGDLVNPGRQ